MRDKRIKLTEEQIAIGMWVYIYLTIKARKNPAGSIWYLKTRYLAGRDVHWFNNCILCERYGCDSCPLSLKDNHKKCNVDSYYDKARDYLIDSEHRRKALIATRKILCVMIEEEEKKHGKA